MPKAPLVPVAVQKATGIFATILIVAGIVTVAYVSSSKNRSPSSQSSQAAAEIPETRTDGPRVILKTDLATTIQYFDGKTERYETEGAFRDAYPTSSIRLMGADAATGAPVAYSTSTDSGPAGIASPNSARLARASEAQTDGAGSASVMSRNGSSERVVFRLADGQPLRSALLLGWLDNDTLAVLATGANARVLAAVPLRGTATVVQDVSDDVLFADVRGGFFWLMTGTPGEGLESPATGPSELIRVSRDGSRDLLAREERRIIQSVVVDEIGSRVAYTTEDGQSVVLRVDDADSKFVIGDRRPLLFLPDGRLLVRDRFALMALDPLTATASPIGTLPEGGVSVFLFDESRRNGS